MWVTVVELYEQGVRRPAEAVKGTQGMFGDLRMKMRSKRAVAALGRRGTAAQTSEVWYDLLTPLPPPRMVGMNVNSFVLQGSQRRHEGGVMIETVQAWWCRPCPNPSA